MLHVRLLGQNVAVQAGVHPLAWAACREGTTSTQEALHNRRYHAVLHILPPTVVLKREHHVGHGAARLLVGLATHVECLGWSGDRGSGHGGHQWF